MNPLHTLWTRNPMFTVPDPTPSADADYRPPTGFELAVLNGLQRLPTVYAGYSDDQVIVHPDGSTEVVPDPRIARTARRRARNKHARKSRRINRIRIH